jgi:hypothetical protein
MRLPISQRKRTKIKGKRIEIKGKRTRIKGKRIEIKGRRKVCPYGVAVSLYSLIH